MPFPVSPNPGDSYTDAYGTVWIYAGSVNGWYRQTVVPNNETTYTGGGSGSATATGAAGEIQFTDGTNLAASPNLLWDDANDELEVTGDLKLLDGGTYTTTLQTITPTANRTISLPDATGTVALVGGSSGQLLWNNAGANAGASTLTYDGSILTTSGRFINSYNATASSPAKAWTGTWFTGGTATTTKPQVLIEPTGTTSTAWSTSGTGLGVNAASGFVGNLLDLQVNGSSQFKVSNNGTTTTGTTLNIGAYPITTLGNDRITTDLQFASYTSRIGSGGVTLSRASAIRWGDFSYSTPDLLITSDAANTLAQRNGTSAQVFRVYNTYTDASNYERGFLRWSSNVFEVGPEAAGTGTTRPMRITAATLKLPNLPTYADNAAATTGGLVAGDVYKTATGELRITV